MKKVMPCFIATFCMLFCVLAYATNDSDWENLNKFTCASGSRLGDRIQGYCTGLHQNWRTKCDSWNNSMSTQKYDPNPNANTTYTVTATASDHSTFSLKASCSTNADDWSFGEMSTTFCNHICDGTAAG